MAGKKFVLKKAVVKPKEKPKQADWDYDKAVNFFTDNIMIGVTSDNVSLTFGIQNVQDASKIQVSNVIYMTYGHFFKLRKLMDEQGKLIEKSLEEKIKKLKEEN